MCTRFVVEDFNDRIRMHDYIKDTHGYGDTLDQNTRTIDINGVIRTQTPLDLQPDVDMSTDVATDPLVDFVWISFHITA